MKYDNYFYINNEINFYLDNLNTIEHFDFDAFVGPPGEKGNLGYTGPRGLQGLQGPRGPAGNQGLQGDKGIQGYRGMSGDPGEQGIQGDDGKKGEIGLRGYIGPKGDFGPRGPPGPPGNEGSKGRKGPVGFSGPVGDIGEIGEPGEAKPEYRDDDKGQELPLMSSLLTMDGMSNRDTYIKGQMQNPFTKFTIYYEYPVNSARVFKCPPNTYLRGFSFMKKGELKTGGWGSENGATLNTGWKAEGKEQGNSFNQDRHGLPHSYKAICNRLNTSNTTVEDIIFK